MLNVIFAVRLGNVGGEVYFKKGEFLIQDAPFKKRDFGVLYGKVDITKLQKVMKGINVNANFYKNKIKKLIRFIEESQKYDQGCVLSHTHSFVCMILNSRLNMIILLKILGAKKW